MNFGDLAFSGSTLGIAVIVIALLVVGTIIFFKRLYWKRTNADLGEKHKGSSWSSPLKARTKYPEVNIFRHTGPLFRLGMIASLLVILFAFNWTQFEREIDIPDDALEFDEEIEIEPPRTAEPPPPPPPPPPPVIEEVPEEEIEEEEEVEFVDQSIEEETIIEEPKPEIKEAPPPPPPPPPPEPEVEEIFKVVEQMPRFPGCENEAGDNKAKEACATQKMLEFIYKNIKYPAIARENGVQGMVVVRFVVEKDGTITDANVVRDIGAGCGEEALRIVQLMNNMPQKWTPGKQRGRAVRVQFNLPVRFRLEG